MQQKQKNFHHFKPFPPRKQKKKSTIRTSFQKNRDRFPAHLRIFFSEYPTDSQENYQTARSINKKTSFDAHYTFNVKDSQKFWSFQKNDQDYDWTTFYLVFWPWKC